MPESTSCACQQPINISGTFPQLALVAGHIPRTETGVGALLMQFEAREEIGYLVKSLASDGVVQLVDLAGHEGHDARARPRPRREPQSSSSSRRASL